MQPPIAPEDRTAKYVRGLLESVARRRAECNQQLAPCSLTSAIHDWWISLPIVARNRRFAMTEISDALYALARHRYSWRALAAALDALNWTTGRDWTRAGRNRRYWHPPQ